MERLLSRISMSRKAYGLLPTGKNIDVGCGRV
jgi:hypothetical protein